MPPRRARYALVEPGGVRVVQLAPFHAQRLRYFSVVEPGRGEVLSSPDQLVLAARGGFGDCCNPARETFNIQLIEAGGRPRIVIWDRGFAANGFVRKFRTQPGALARTTYLAFGGEYIDPSEGEWQERDPRDGVHVLRSGSLDAIRTGSWYTPQHGYQREESAGKGGGSPTVKAKWEVSRHHYALDGRHEGRVDARGKDNVMMLDGKLSAVLHADGHWLLYGRANLKQRGGRFVAVARSLTSSPCTSEEAGGAGGGNLTGAQAKAEPKGGGMAPGLPAHSPSHSPTYGPFRLISIAGYDERAWGNVYFAAIDRHPLDDDMLVGLFPVNLGRTGEGNGDGEAFLGMSLSCDGVHWSPLSRLMASVARTGRTWDHPVDGLVREPDGGVSFLVHHDVEGISPHERNSSVAKYRLRLSSFREITREARASEHTGCRPRQQFSVGGARPDAPLAPQCIHPTSCAHLPPAQAAWLREVEEEAAAAAGDTALSSASPFSPPSLPTLGTTPPLAAVSLPASPLPDGRRRGLRRVGQRLEAGLLLGRCARPPTLQRHVALLAVRRRAGWPSVGPASRRVMGTLLCARLEPAGRMRARKGIERIRAAAESA